MTSASGLLLGAAAAAGVGAVAWSRGAIPRRAPLEADLTGRVVIVTGANSGIGKETAFALAAMGATVVMACRNLDKAEAAAAELHTRRAGLALVTMPLDLSSMDSVRHFVGECTSRIDRLDVLVNNAGRVVGSHRLTDGGFEATLATNVLGPMLLTDLLRPLLEATGRRDGPARIINVASSTHRRGELQLDDLQYASRRYRPLGVYATSKLATVLWTLELARRVDPVLVTVNCLHPGNITSGFGQDDESPAWIRALMPWSRQLFLTPQRGADTSVWLAASPEAATEHGGYFYRRRRWQPSAGARNPVLAAGLWERSRQLLGLAD